MGSGFKQTQKAPFSMHQFDESGYRMREKEEQPAIHEKEIVESASAWTPSQRREGGECGGVG